VDFEGGGTRCGEDLSGRYGEGEYVGDVCIIDCMRGQVLFRHCHRCI